MSSVALFALMVTTSSGAVAAPPPAPLRPDRPKQLERPDPPPPPPLPEPPQGPRNRQKEVQVDDNPVVIAEGGDMGMAFRFGGLASLAVDGNTRVLADAFPITQVGLKFVSSRNLHFPVFFGVGARSEDSGPGNAQGIWGLEFGGGVEWHFRIWRRISPYVGAVATLGVINGQNDRLAVGVGLGPVLGIEYFVADRVSLSAQYGLALQFVSVDDGDDSIVDFGTLASGAATLTFYF